jgi:hypothetical protein
MLDQNGKMTVPDQKAHFDELFKPQDALNLLQDASAANKQVFGPQAIDALGSQLYAMGSSLHPEVFKQAADGHKQNAAASYSTIGSFAASVASSAAFKFLATAGLEMAFRGEAPPSLVSAIVNGGSIGSGIVAHRLVYREMTGHSESWSDSVINGGAAALTPMIARSAYGAISRNPALAARLNWRLSELSTESVLARTANEMGGDPTFAKLAQVFEKSGLTSQAGKLAALGDKTLSSASQTELASLNNSLNLAGNTGRQALIKILPNAQKAATEAAGTAPSTFLGRARDAIVGYPGRTLAKVKDVAWDNRFYRWVPAGQAAPGEAATSGGFVNLQKLNPATAELGQLKAAGHLSGYIHSSAASVPALAFFNTTDSLYNNWWKGKSYVGADNQNHKFSFTDALVQSNFGHPGDSLIKRATTSTPGEALTTGFLLKGALSADDAGLSNSGSLLGSTWQQVKRGASYGFALGNPQAMQGFEEWIQGRELNNTANEIEGAIDKPLQDYPTADKANPQ